MFTPIQTMIAFLGRSAEEISKENIEMKKWNRLVRKSTTIDSLPLATMTTATRLYAQQRRIVWGELALVDAIDRIRGHIQSTMSSERPVNHAIWKCIVPFEASEIVFEAETGWLNVKHTLVIP